LAISSSTRKAGPFLGNDATTVFPFAFKVFTSADLRVVNTSALGIESDLVLDTDYTVTLNSNQDNDPGGTVTRATALPTGQRLTITSDVEALQPLVLTNNGGFYPRVINDAFDKITIIAQQLIEQVGRSLKLPISSSASATLPDPVANRLIAWNSSANGFTNVDPASIATLAAYSDARIDLFNGNGTQTAFTLTEDPVVLANLSVSISGVVQVGGEDFTWSGTTVTFVTAPPTGTRIQVRYARVLSPTDIAALAAAAAADRVQTGLDRVQTGLDRVQTGADATAAAAAAALAQAAVTVVTPEQYGAVGDGTTNDSAAWISAIAAGLPIECPQGKTYKVTSALTMTASKVDINLNGSTIKPTGAIVGFNSSTSAAATTTVSSGANIGSTSIVVASATGLAVGQWVVLSSNDALHAASSYPPCWTKIVAIAGTTITLDNALAMTYPGAYTTTLVAYAALKESFSLRNGVIDGTDSTYTAGSGGAMYVSGFKSVNIQDVVVKNFTQISANNTPIQIFQCPKVKAQFRIEDCASAGNFVDIQLCGVAQVYDSVVDASGFGINFVRCDIAQITSSVLRGRAKAEVAGTALGSSTRGVKFYGCGYTQVDGLTVSEYESGIKQESSFRYNFNNVTLFNMGLSNFSIALNISSTTSGTNLKGGTLAGINIHNVLGGGIGISSDTGECVISGFNIKNTTYNGIYIDTGIGTVDNIVISNGIIENWDTATAGVEGIRALKGASVHNVRFLNTDTSRICLRGPLEAGYKFSYSGLVAVDGNPLFTSTLNYETNGSATIASGSTSIVVTHGLIATPAASDITLTPTATTTTDPGNIWVDTITSTQFTIRCRVDPGAGGLVLAWRAALKMPIVT
jgi:hypothetical protein